MVGHMRRNWQVALGVLALVAVSVPAFAQEQAAEAASGGGIDIIEMFRGMGPTAWGVAIAVATAASNISSKSPCRPAPTWT